MIDIRDAFFKELYNIAQRDSQVILLTADQGAWALDKFRTSLPSQFINIGIAEQNLINLATGLTLGGKRVFAYAIASFIIYRSFEQIKVNVCDNLLPVVLIGAGPGLSYKADGATHHCIYDIPIMGLLPITIITPHNEEQGIRAAQIGYSSKGPVYIRLSADMPAIYGKYRDNYTEMPFIIHKGVAKLCAGQIKSQLKKS